MVAPGAPRVLPWHTWEHEEKRVQQQQLPLHPRRLPPHHVHPPGLHRNAAKHTRGPQVTPSVLWPHARVETLASEGLSSTSKWGSQGRASTLPRAIRAYRRRRWYRVLQEHGNALEHRPPQEEADARLHTQAAGEECTVQCTLL